MTKDERIEYLARGINSSITPYHVRVEMQETLSALLAPEPAPAPPPPPPKPKPKPKPKPAPPKPPTPTIPDPPELTADQLEARTEELKRRRDRKISAGESE